jgi:hypothetical protein
VRRIAALATPLALVGILLLASGRGAAGPPAAAGATSAGSPTAGASFEPELGVPATNVVAFGASPGEASGEVWAYGELGYTPVSVEGHSYSEQYVLLQRSSTSAGWQVLPLPSGRAGKPLAGPGGSSGPAAYGALAGQATDAGGVVLLSGQSLVVRDPGGQPRLVPEPGALKSSSEESSSAESSTVEEPGVLAEGESLLPNAPSGKVTVPYAAIEEAEGHRTGVLIAPYRDGGNPAGEPKTQPGVLHYDGLKWTREPIEVPAAQAKGFTALAMSCSGTQQAPASSSPEDCWLLAGYGTGGARGAPDHLALFRRVRGALAGEPAMWSWEPQPVSDWLLGQAHAPSGITQSAVEPLGGGAQMLTATPQGAWVDFQASVNGEATPVDVSELVLTPAAAGGEARELPQASVAGTWCYPTGALCERSLGASLPAQYRSFAWPGSALSEPGSRIITGLPDRAMLELYGGSFHYEIGAGGEPGFAPGGAAFYGPSPQGTVEGWIADGIGVGADGGDGEGQSPAIELTASPEGDQLQEESVPFRRPLLALAQPSESTPGDPAAEAIAVGVEGEIGRYAPGEGWRSESLYDSDGQIQTPTLRGVAWQEPGRIYAVGDNGAMWLWRAETGLWEPDPAKPFNFIGNLTAIAFQPGEPQRGYAVGKQGVLLSYGKAWEQMTLPAELQQANFTSVAFAGGEALATYRTIATEANGEQIETGGVAVEEGSGWHVDPGTGALLAQLPYAGDSVLSKIAGLPDGGVVAAGPGVVIERDTTNSTWRFSSEPLPEAQNVSALGAYQEAGGPVRAVISIDLDRALNPQNSDGDLTQGPYTGDAPTPTGPGQPPPFIPADPLPDSGYVLKETASGWSDVEHQALPVVTGEDPSDLPARPDPVLALLVSPDGNSGLAVGGQTYDTTGSGPDAEAETAAALRFPASSASSNGATPTPIVTPPGQASFVVAGQASCARACANLANDGLGPDAWLTHALQTAHQIAAENAGGLRGFLYTGGRLPANITSGTGVGGEGLGPEAFERELDRYQALLSAGGSPPVYPAASKDVEPASAGSGPFAKILLPAGVSAGPVGTAAYSFASSGSAGEVKAIVLDYSSGELGVAQSEWLERELLAARHTHVPAIAIGSDSLGFTLPDQSSAGGEVVEARDHEAVSRILVRDGASAYLFDYPGSNVQTKVSYGSEPSLPAFGTGTLGFVSPPESLQHDSLGSSGLLLLSVNVAASNSTNNVAPVSAQVVPNIAQLALQADNGVLLRRSQVGLFEGLARRPAGGEEAAGGAGGGGTLIFPDPYDPIPFDCQGANCPYQVPSDYTFSSSNPDVGGFVVHEASSDNPRQVLLSSKRKPVSDEPKMENGEPVERNGELINEQGEAIPRDGSGLFCAYNEGTTTVSITTGGLTYSEPVTVQGGSVEYPCGTVPLKNPPPRPARASRAFTVPNLSPAPSNPHAPQIQSLAPPPVPVPVAPHHHAIHRPAPLPAVPFAAVALFPVPALVPPPAPAAARPTPPSGTAQVPAQSPVSQQVGVSEREREHSTATESVHHMAALQHEPLPGAAGSTTLPANILDASHSASAYATNAGPIPAWSLALVLVAVLCALGLRPGAGSERLVRVGVKSERDVQR